MTTTSKLNLSLNASNIHYTHHFLWRCQVQVLDTFRYAANEFYSKIFFTVYSRLNIRILKAYLQYKFTPAVQRVNGASFFEVTTSRSCDDVNGFHNVTFGPGGKTIISCLVCFGKIPGFNLWKLSWLSGVFPPFVRQFSKWMREPEVKLHHVVYEVWLVSYLFFSFQIWCFRKWIIKANICELHVSTPYGFLI